MKLVNILQPSWIRRNDKVVVVKNQPTESQGSKANQKPAPPRQDIEVINGGLLNQARTNLQNQSNVPSNPPEDPRYHARMLLSLDQIEERISKQVENAQHAKTRADVDSCLQGMKELTDREKVKPLKALLKGELPKMNDRKELALALNAIKDFVNGLPRKIVISSELELRIAHLEHPRRVRDAMSAKTADDVGRVLGGVESFDDTTKLALLRMLRKQVKLMDGAQSDKALAAMKTVAASLKDPRFPKEAEQMLSLK